MPRQFGVPEEVISSCTSGGFASAYAPYLEPIRDKHIIGVNNAYMIARWIDVEFFGDCAWYNVHRFALAEWPGLKITCCERFHNKPEPHCEGIKFLIRRPDKTRGLSDDPSKVCWNNNSGCAAINVAAHLGVKCIILLGFDMKLDPNKVSHWHGSHGQKPKGYSPPFDRHLLSFPAIAEDAKNRGIEILNASPDSAITVFPRISVKEALDESRNLRNLECPVVG